MKAIVFDNAGTIIKRVNALKDLSNNNILFETNTVGMVNQNDDSLILVFQTPTKKIIQHEGKVIDYLKSNRNSFEIAYSTKNYTKDDVINSLRNDSTTINDIKDSSNALIKNYDIEICSGSAMIVNIKENKIDYVYTAGGIFFNYTRDIFKKLNKKNFSIFIASGDNEDSLSRIAFELNIPSTNVYNTCNVDCKQKVIQKLQKEYSQVIMVGNQSNDIQAITQADVGILSIQQGEKISDELIDSADYIIGDIKEVLKIVDEV